MLLFRCSGKVCCFQWRTQKGGEEWGVWTFQRVGPRDSHENVIKLVGEGGGRQICQEVLCQILEKKAENGFSRISSKI